MNHRTSRLAWSICAASLAFTAAGLLALYLNRSTLSPISILLLPSTILPGSVYAALGALIASRRPRNPIGWLLAIAGLDAAIQLLALEYAIRGFVTAPGSLPAATFSAWLFNWVSYPVFWAVLPMFFLLFPDGRLASRWLRPLPWLVVAVAGLQTIAFMLTPGMLRASNQGISQKLSLVINPTGISRLGSLLVGAQGLLNLVFTFIVLACIAALVLRFRRARGEEREQIKWLGYVSALLAVSAPPLILAGGWAANIAWLLFAAAFTIGIPGATAIAILKYRLYDIDLVINKSLVFGALAVFITAVYVAIVVGIGALVGTGGRPNLALSILATAIVAVAFQPVREWTQRLANRLVYGQRDTPYEVLAHFSEGVATTYSSNEVLPRMARILAQGTGAAAASVWTVRGEDLVPAATYPEGEPPVAAETASRSVAIFYQGDQLGELRVRKRPGEAMTPVEDKLFRDLAGQAGLLLKNVSLTADLQARLGQISAQTQELRLSRARIVAAQDAERRRLERNIHDGAQQHLVALAVKLKLTATLARRKPEQALSALDDLQSVTREALQTLTELAGGIYPSALREHGLRAALQSQAQRMTIPVAVDAPDLPRLPLEVEAAAYFACLEALQNVAKHARASSVRIRLSTNDDALTFSVHDDGIGLAPGAPRGSGLQNMADRISALGGRIEVHGKNGSGTTVTGGIPILVPEPAA